MAMECAEVRPEETAIRTLGGAPVRSPLPLSTVLGDGVGNFVPDGARILYDVDRGTGEVDCADVRLEKAGPREHLHFDPARASAAIVTCGGLCPGLNNVIRSVCRQLWNYGVRRVLGIRDGFRGLNPVEGRPPIELTNEFVDYIHRQGGTVLGSSRGPQDTGTMLDRLAELDIQILFCVGGDGTQRGAHALAAEALRRGMDLSVVGIPKTIDNDIGFISRSFGYSTAVEEARKVIDCAHTEARGAPDGVGLVKLMGRHSGFIAVGAALASQVVNLVLIPELRFDLEGPEGICERLRARMERKSHAVIAVAEGAGQDLLQADERQDASGNRVLGDIGLFLKSALIDYFQSIGRPISLKYIDPSYMIRSVEANCEDALLCDRLARAAAHAGLAGKTDLIIGLWNDALIHVPIPLAVRRRKQVDPESELWISVHESTGQPLRFRPRGGETPAAGNA
jgi:6-phosphofructokinase 1